jgi:SAM-dependent methyltransferase
MSGDPIDFFPYTPDLEARRVREAARRRLGEGLGTLFVRQAWTEIAIAWRKNVRFRRGENAEVVRAYCAMTAEEFDGINARQKWANWRTIPRNLSGRLGPGPCRAVDLCCGVGHSTEVLAYCLPPGSSILGLEYNPEFTAVAAKRSYTDERGGPVKVEFRVQSVLETFRDSAGRPLGRGTVDLVNSCGALGIHFDQAQIGQLATEIARVLRGGGLATVDSGKEGVDEERMVPLFERRGFEAVARSKSCFLDRFTQICFRKRWAS